MTTNDTTTPQERIDAARVELSDLAAVIPGQVARDLLGLLTGQPISLPREHLTASLRAAVGSLVDPPSTTSGVTEAWTDPALSDITPPPDYDQLLETTLRPVEQTIISQVRATGSTNGFTLEQTRELRTRSVIAWIPRQGAEPGRWVLPYEIGSHVPRFDRSGDFYADVCLVCGLHESDPITHPEPETAEEITIQLREAMDVAETEED